MRKKLILLLIIGTGAYYVNAQETLPRFSAVDKGGSRIIVSWFNPYLDTIRQLTVQRSFDSLKGFKSILTLPDPTVPQNGYVDAQAPAPRMFYRLYIQLDNGRFLFSKSQRPALDTAGNAAGISQVIYNSATDPSNNGKQPETSRDQIKLTEKALPRVLYIKVKETFLAQIPETYLKRFRDSINYRTKDTLSLIFPDTILIKQYVPVVAYKASKYVYTAKDGNVAINIPDVASGKYHIRFLEEDGTFLFEIKHIKESTLLLDKSNFNHSGWFRFELYNDAEEKEKWKFFIPKDF